jgi:hypothetical protein
MLLVEASWNATYLIDSVLDCASDELWKCVIVFARETEFN